MQKLLMTLALTVSAGSLIACKKDTNADRAEKAAENLTEARENVNEAAKKVAEERKDVMEENRDVAAARNDLAGAQAKAEQARTEFVRAAQIQIEGVTQQLAALEARWGAKGKEKVVVLRTQVVELEKLRDEAANTATADWQATQQRFEAAVKRFEESVKDMESKK